MLRKLLVLPFLLAAGICQGQNSIYTGRFTIIGPGSENADIYINQLTITVDPAGAATIILHFKGGSRTEKEDYIDLSGTISGTVENEVLTANGVLASVLKDGKRLQTGTNNVTIKGTVTEDKAEGKVFIYESKSGERTDAFFSFKASLQKELKPELTFPAGNSPKVFNRGWIFGAEFIITDESGNEIDLSDKIQWSGTASFNPATGKSSHPLFNTVGGNKIILTVQYEGKTYKGEYPVTTVDVGNYAFQGCKAFCPADAHGGPSDPLPVVGPIIEGSPLILINGHPAARVGDMGVHAVCTGANSYTISTGDYDVLIDGRPAARFGLSQTIHCGGRGEILPANRQDLIIANKEVAVSGNEKGSGGEISLSADEELTTGDKGLLSFPAGSEAVVTVLPSSSVKIVDNTLEKINLMLKYGLLIVNGNTGAEKQLMIELKKLSVTPKGTKFTISTDSMQSVINVYHGAVTITEKATGKISEVTAGNSYRYINDRGEIFPLSDSSGISLVRDRLATVDNTSIKTSNTASAPAEKAGKSASFDFKKFIRENVLYIAMGAGALVLVILLLIMGRKKRNKERV